MPSEQQTPTAPKEKANNTNKSVDVQPPFSSQSSNSSDGNASAMADKVIQAKSKPIESDIVLNEDKKSDQRKSISCSFDTIPVYCNKKGHDGSTITTSSGKLCKSVNSSKTSSDNEPPSVEENSDGYNSAAHMEHVMAELTSESNPNLEDYFAIEPSKNQCLHFDEQSEPSDTSRSEEQSRKLFDPQLLGNDETEYYQTRFKSIVSKNIPDKIAIPKARQLPPTRKHGKKYSCGMCNIMKLYIVVTLTIGIIANMFFEPTCFGMKAFSANSTQPLAHTNVKQVHIFVSPQSQAKHLTTSKSLRRVATEHRQIAHQRIADDQENSADEDENCCWKKIYIISMSIGLLVYLAIFMLYTCRLVVRYHMVAWFQIEACALLGYSLFLLIPTVRTVCLIKNMSIIIVNSLVLSDAVLGFFISFWAYRQYTLGKDPFSLINTADRSTYEITQILAYRQVAKLFALDTVHHQHGIKRNGNLSPSEFQATFSPNSHAV